MKALITILFACTMLVRQSGHAQNVEQWELAISALTGRNYYNKKYFDQPRLAPGWETNFKSDYLWSVGMRAEKHLSPHFAALAELRYTEEGVPDNMFCACNSISDSPDNDEKVYRGAVDAGIRYYVNPISKVLFFFEGSVSLDWLIGVRQTGYILSESQVFHKMHWDSYGYKRFAPGGIFSLGMKWKRLSLDVGGMTNLSRTMVRNPGTYDSVFYPIKTGFFGRGLFVKTSFTLFKFK
ncbi:hypothetical protein [Dyadobacter beijingensis]|nr:hypothetical protein [Dyadobacter beijingensis]